ncbi:MAG: hypothetical protein L6V93_07605 [Clostridiales bacterium]|nr:MAG: hypothetical protein L6V93_07605 [Clostridiales bacterium]
MQSHKSSICLNTTFFLKDDKTYPFARVSVNERFPKITMVRSVKKDGARYFGPYSSGMLFARTYRIFLKEVYKIRGCNKVFFRAISTKAECALYYHIGKCDGVCGGNADEEEYNKKINEICAFF